VCSEAGAGGEGFCGGDAEGSVRLMSAVRLGGGGGEGGVPTIEMDYLCLET